MYNKPEFSPVLRAVVPGCAGCAMAHPDFGRSDISTRGDRLCPPNYYWHTQIFRPSDGPEGYDQNWCFPDLAQVFFQKSKYFNTQIS